MIWGGQTIESLYPFLKYPFTSKQVEKCLLVFWWYIGVEYEYRGLDISCICMVMKQHCGYFVVKILMNIEWISTNEKKASMASDQSIIPRYKQGYR